MDERAKREYLESYQAAKAKGVPFFPDAVFKDAIVSLVVFLLLVGLAFVGFFLNLFNLIPIVPLDGGRAAGALHPVFWFVGLLMMLALVVLRPNPILILIVIIGGLDLWRRWRERGENKHYYDLPVRRRVTVGIVYLGLVAVLALAMSATYVERDF